MNGETQLADSGEDLLDPEGDLDGEDKLKKENARLATKVTELQELNRKALSWVKVVKQLKESDEGQEILAKLQKGEPLTKEEKKEVVEEGVVTKKELRELLAAERKEIVRETSEAQSVNVEAREARKVLEDWASEKFDGYKEIRGSSGWARRFNLVAENILTGVDEGTLTVPEEYGGDPWKWATAETYSWVLSQNPELGKGLKKKSKPTEEELKAQKLQQSTKSSSSSPSTLNEIPEEDRKEVERIRRIGGSRIVGQRFSG